MPWPKFKPSTSQVQVRSITARAICLEDVEVGMDCFSLQANIKFARKW